MNQQIHEFKYYNLCLPKEILDTAKSIAAKKGLKLKNALLFYRNVLR